jgi:hypothetical protein
MEEKRIKLYQGMKSDGLTKTYRQFITTYFSNSQGVDKLYNALIDGGDFDKSLKVFYEKFCCDLDWAKKTTYCGGSGGGNTTTSSWDNYPCVVELAKSKGISKESNNSYVIDDFRYFPNGRKGNISTRKIVNFTCNDPEFKKSNSSGGNSSSNENSVSNGIYTTKGDPYQYKIVDCVWYTKGKAITDWKSLEDNKDATGILDGRFPNARKNCKENKPDNQNAVTGGGQQQGQSGSNIPTGGQQGQSGSNTPTGGQSGVNQTQGLGAPNVVDLGLDEIDKMVNPVKTELQQDTTQRPQVPVDSSLEGVPTTQQESVEVNTDILKEEFYSTLKKIL